jgi:hypothetical protein
VLVMYNVNVCSGKVTSRKVSIFIVFFQTRVIINVSVLPNSADPNGRAV